MIGKCLRIVSLIISVSVAALKPASTQEQLEVFSPNWFAHRDAPNSLYQYFHEQTVSLLQRRDSDIASIESMQQLIAKQSAIQSAISSAIGPFPERTELNAKVQRTVAKEGYRMEHILFESRPGFMVSATLYLPEGVDKAHPAILYCAGHNVLGYRSPTYQHVIINLVKKGFVVMAFDPVGQGERIQYYDPETEQLRVGSPTRQHSYPAIQLLLTGTNLANYMTWDGIRALDYLVSRPEVDPSRIGVTGRSGGGTQAAYLGVLDDRVSAVAIENYLTSFARLYESKGPQDAEQHLTKGILKGIDHPDFLIARLPKPTMLIATTNDFFSIQGARETFWQAQGLAKRYPEGQRNLYMVEDDAGHSSTLKNREAMYAFFQNHLSNPGDSTDINITVPEVDELRVTTSGQLLTSTTSETLFSLNKTVAEKLSTQLSRSNHPRQMDTIKELIGYVEPTNDVTNVFTGRVIREDYTIEKYFITSDRGYTIPYLYFKPENWNGKAVIYVHPEGKQAVAEAGGGVEHLVKAGYALFAPDLIGIGEMGPGDYQGDAYLNGISYNLIFMGQQIGQTIVGLRASDLTTLRKTIANTFAPKAIYAVSVDEMAVPLLHAAYLDEEVSGLITTGNFATFAELARTEYYDSRHAFNVVPDALIHYDLPLLSEKIAERGYAHLGGEAVIGEAMMQQLEAMDSNKMAVSEASEWDLEIARVTEEKHWNEVTKIRQRIIEPSFNDRDVHVNEIKPHAGTGEDVRAIIQDAIDACARAGGGKVIIPSGIHFINGPIHMRSNVHLHLSEGSELSFGTDPEQYLPLVKVRWEGTVCYNYSPLIYGYNLKDVAITGSGTINGNGREWSIDWRTKQRPAQLSLRDMGQHEVPEKERIFGPGHYLRPTLVEFYECENVWMEGITLRDSPFWTVHPVFSKNVILRKLTISSNSLNDDGIDPDSSEDVLIEYCNIDTHDDAISVKAGRDQDAWGRKGSRNIIIQHNTLSSQSNALCVGSEMSGTVQDIYMDNNIIRRANNAINLKCNLDRGGAIRNVFVRKTTVDSVQSDLFKVQMDYHSYRGGNFPTEIERIYINGVRAAYVGEHPVQVVGVPQSEVSKIMLQDVHVDMRGKPSVLRYVNQVVGQ